MVVVKPRESAVELRQRAHVNNVIHCLLMTAVTEVWCDKVPYVSKVTSYRLILWYL